MMNPTDITQNCWLIHDWVRRSANQWMAYPGIGRKILHALTGEQHTWRGSLLDKILAARNREVRILELGCGKLPLATQLAFPAEIVLVDLVDFGLELPPNVRFYQCDLNGDLSNYPPGPFDLVIISNVAHHISNQDGFASNVHALLKDDGILFLDDYIGPRWLEFDASTLAIGCEYLLRLPESNRLLVEDGMKTEPWHGGYESAWAKTDPSEACGSDLTLSSFMRHFVPINYWAGGTLLYMVLEFISQNFPDDESSAQYLNELWLSERILLTTGQLAPWFCMAIMQKRRLAGHV